MSKYKIGDKVLIEGIISGTEGDMKCWISFCKGGYNYVVDQDDIRPFTEKTYEDGLNDAWAVAKKIIDLHVELNDFEYVDLFDGCVNQLEVLDRLTAAETIERIVAWEEAHTIHVNDVVRINDSKEYGVVTDADSNLYRVISDNGMSWLYGVQNITKTGRTVDIMGLLKQIKGGDEDE